MRAWFLVFGGLVVACGSAPASSEEPIDEGRGGAGGFAAPEAGAGAAPTGEGGSPAITPPSHDDGAGGGSPTVATVGAGGGDVDPPPTGCQNTAASAGDFTVQLEHDGLQREVLVHVPPQYVAGQALPLVVTYHALLLDAASIKAVTRMSDAADERGFIVAYPNGIEHSWNAGECCAEAKAQKIDDVGFTRAFLAELEAKLCIDPQRVYATGFSNGGFLSHRVACEMSEVFAAVAPVSGTLGIPQADCHPTRPVPTFQVHGTDDELVPYEGGPPNVIGGASWGVFLGVEATRDFWRVQNGCEAGSAISYANGEVACETWAQCQAGSEVTLCTVDGGGHQWPGGGWLPFMGHQTQDLDATQAIVDFLLAHPMP